MIIAGDFPLTAQTAFRLAEKASLLDPGKILGTEQIGSFDQNAVIIAENEKICMTYVYNKWNWTDPDGFVYMDKTGDLTFTSVSPFHGYNNLGGVEDNPFLVILFDDFPDAVRAELDLRPCVTTSNGTKEARWNLIAGRHSDGYFLFKLDRSFNNDFLLFCLQSSLTDTIPSSTFSASTVIRLYDKNNQLILERELDLDEQY